MITLFSRKKANINSVKIPDFGWEKEKNNRNLLLWINPEQTIALSLHYFDLEPDLPSLKNVDVLRNFHRKSIAEQNGGLLQVEFSLLKKYKAIKTIFKIPQEPSGMVYLASTTIPFKDCSYVIKIQAPEVGMTGLRDSVIADRLIQEKIISIGENGFENWMSDPYDSNFNKGTLMNKSEDEIFDKDFENHPLTKVRKMMAKIEKEIQFKSELEKLEVFEK